MKKVLIFCGLVFAIWLYVGMKMLGAGNPDDRLAWLYLLTWSSPAIAGLVLAYLGRGGKAGRSHQIVGITAGALSLFSLAVITAQIYRQQVVIPKVLSEEGARLSEQLKSKRAYYWENGSFDPKKNSVVIGKRSKSNPRLYAIEVRPDMLLMIQEEWDTKTNQMIYQKRGFVFDGKKSDRVEIHAQLTNTLGIQGEYTLGKEEKGAFDLKFDEMTFAEGIEPHSPLMRSVYPR